MFYQIKVITKFYQSVEINHNPNGPNLYRILSIGGSGSGKTDVLLNLIKHH